jgi:hypothetical protein
VRNVKILTLFVIFIHTFLFMTTAIIWLYLPHKFLKLFLYKGNYRSYKQIVNTLYSVNILAIIKLTMLVRLNQTTQE